ncbi:hypothetical protein G6F67_009420 [Rhizopus microsporus]|nr:hypothetical protein G6F67_009420 [Rhizopus microsporus]
MYPRHQLINNHNIELIDPNEPTISAMPVYNAQNTTLPLNHVNPSKNTLSLQQLTALDVTNHRNHVQSNNFNGYNHANANQQGLVELIQQTIRQELNNQPQYRNSRYNNYNRTGRYDNNDNSNNRSTKHSVKKLNGSVAFDNSQKNGQPNTHNNTKSINNTQQHQLNAILTENEHKKSKYHQDLYAAIRPERPPEIGTALPYPKAKTTKDKGKQPVRPSVTKRVTTRSHIEEINPTPQPNTSIQTQPIEMDTDVPIQEKPKRRMPRTKRTPPEIKYDIVSDVLKQKADIEIGDLITVAPSLRRKLVNECRPKRKPKQEQLK